MQLGKQVDDTMRSIAELASRDQSHRLLSARYELTAYQCYEPAVELFDERCFDISQVFSRSTCCCRPTSLIDLRRNLLYIFGAGDGSLLATNVVVVVVVIGFSISQNFFISQPIVIKLRTQIGDNILHNRTVSNFQVVIN